jgi:uncharacterized membrane protein YeaQ/YmgE (transglycosylase-associated protein family)
VRINTPFEITAVIRGFYAPPFKGTGDARLLAARKLCFSLRRNNRLRLPLGESEPVSGPGGRKSHPLKSSDFPALFVGERNPFRGNIAGHGSVYISVGPFKVDLRRIVMGFIAWIVVGLIAGWLAGKVMKGGGYGIIVDIILGILGGVVGGWVFGLLGIWPGGGMIGSIIVAFVGAVILVWITRLLKKA